MERNTLRIVFEKYSEFNKFVTEIKHPALMVPHQFPTTNDLYVDIFLKNILPSKLWKIRPIIEKATIWRVGGPVCPIIPQHGPTTNDMRDLRWHCRAVGCSGKQNLDESKFLTWFDFSVCNRFSIDDSAEKKRGDRFKELLYCLIYGKDDAKSKSKWYDFDSIENSIKERLLSDDEYSKMIDKVTQDAHEKWAAKIDIAARTAIDAQDWHAFSDGSNESLTIDKEKKISELEDRAKSLSSDLKEMDEQMKGLNIMSPRFSKILDEAYRFLCGLNLQDHTVAEQREYLRIIRELRPFILKLKGARSESRPS